MSDRPNIEIKFFHKHDRDTVKLGKCGPKIRLKISKPVYTRQREIADLNNPAIDLDDDDVNPNSIEEVHHLPCGCDFNQLKTIAETINESAGRVDFLHTVKRTNEQKLKESIDNLQLVVAVIKDPNHPKNGQIIGCLSTLPHSEDGLNRDVQYSGMFSVRDDFQGKGVARKLVEFIFRTAIENGKKALQFTVWVPGDDQPHAQSERLISMYTRGGGVLVGEKNLLECYPHYKDFLKRPCNVLFFEIELNKTELFLKALRSSKLFTIFRWKKDGKSSEKGNKEQNVEKIEEHQDSSDNELLVDKLEI